MFKKRAQSASSMNRTIGLMTASIFDLLQHRGGRGRDFDRSSSLSDNPSRDNGWSGYLAGKNSTQGGDR